MLRRPEPSLARLTIRKPRGARIRLNGMWLEERVPLIDHPLEPGEHRIEVVKRKVKKRFHVEAKPGESIDLTAR